MSRLSEQLTGARLAALQAQLNPHFLFNSLNTIAVLVRDGDAPTATRVIEQLSDVLRRTLSRTQSNEVTLDDELALVRQYLAVEQARFSDRLRPEFDVDDSLRNAAVPAFAISACGPCQAPRIRRVGASASGTSPSTDSRIAPLHPDRRYSPSVKTSIPTSR